MTRLNRFSLFRATLALGALMVAAPAYATPYGFANFNILNANQPFSFTNNGANPGTGTLAATANVTFDFTAQTGLPTIDHTAVLTLSGKTFTQAQSAFGIVDQSVSQLSTLSIIGTGVDAGKNLLTMTFTGDLLGKLGGASADILGADTTGNTVTFTSDFGTFIQPGNSFDLGLNTISPSLSLGLNNFLNSFIANINGQFTANFVAVPAPTSVVMFGCGLAATGLLATQRKRLSKLNRS